LRGAPISRLREIGIEYAQIGQARLAWRRSNLPYWRTRK
jgi:hypothetical protein